LCIFLDYLKRYNKLILLKQNKSAKYTQNGNIPAIFPQEMADFG